MADFHCIATGDTIITRSLPEGGYPGFGEVADFIAKGNFRFTNLETTIHNFESFPSEQSGGSWLCSPPEVLEDVKRFGFNILSTANNHALDYSYGGLRKTLDYIRAAGLKSSGTGENLFEASAPAYIETTDGRYALISCSLSFNPGDSAGEQIRSMAGRPGMNVVRSSKEYILPQEDLRTLERIGADLHLNDGAEILRKEGYLPPKKDSESLFGAMSFKKGDKAEVIYKLNTVDMERISSVIREARFMADYVVISVHNHATEGMEKERVDSLSINFAHSCIDAGADAVIGTGPHLLRAMEIYQGKPVFYCLGDFIIQLETLLRIPHDLYAKQGLTGKESLDAFFNARSNFGKRGLSYDRRMFESVIPYWETKDGKLTKVLLMPIEENFDLPRPQQGFPRKKTDGGILERFCNMSKPFGVDIVIREDGLGEVVLER